MFLAPHPVHHAPEHRRCQLALPWVSHVWELRTDDPIDVGGRARLALLVHDDQEVSVREATFLVLHHESVSHGLAEETVLREGLEERTQLQVEHARHELGPITPMIARR